MSRDMVTRRKAGPNGLRVAVNASPLQLWPLTRTTLSASIDAKAHYLALIGEASATPAAVDRAKIAWEKLDARKRAIAARMGEIEEQDQATSA